MLRYSNVWVGSLIAFIASGCTLVIELIAGRIMAPYIGVSLYTWTSIIGVVLAGISLGNYVGGRIADRRATPTTLGLLFIVSGLATLFILFATQLLANGALPRTIPLVPRIVLYTTIIFFLPSFLLGTISPVVVKLTLNDLNQTGNVVGRIYAFSTAGSIVGTFLTGFVLVEMMGTRAIVWSVGILLIFMGLVIGQFWRGLARQMTGAMVVAGLGGFLWQYGGQFQAPCLKETSYYCIKVIDQELPEGIPVKALVLDHLIHSYNSVEDPTVLGYGYERIYAEITTYVAEKKPALRALFVGGGGYTFPRYLEAVYPQSQIDVVEIDPWVTEISHLYLGLRRDTRIRTFNQDARLFFIERQPEKEYDVIYGDAFNDLSIPYHLTTAEFAGQLRKSLKDDGLYIANVIDNFQTGEFLRAYMRALKVHFPYLYLFGIGRSWEVNAPNTFVVVAALQPLDLQAWQETVARKNGGRITSAVLPAEDLARYLRSGRPIVLTDDYAPADNLVAPLFIQRERVN